MQEMIDVSGHPAHGVVDGFGFERRLRDDALAPPLGGFGKQQSLAEQRLDVPVADILHVLLAMRDQHLLEHLGIREHVEVLAADGHAREAAVGSRDVGQRFHGVLEKGKQAANDGQAARARRMLQPRGRAAAAAVTTVLAEFTYAPRGPRASDYVFVVIDAAERSAILESSRGLTRDPLDPSA